MRLWTQSGFICVAVALFVGCNTPAHHKVLSFFFDGVPPPKTAHVEEGQPAETAKAPPPRAARRQEHDPYAAKMCSACHDAAATNALVEPPDKLCVMCHDLKLDKKDIHAPVESGDCLACHDPHTSQYRYLLVSEPDTVCFQCHDRDSVTRVKAHEGVTEQCTVCHDAHMSDRAYLLK